MDAYRGSRVGVIVQCERGYVVAYSYFALSEKIRMLPRLRLFDRATAA